jgi:hypothetical protein
MSAIAGSFYSPFPTTGELGLSLASIQGGTSTAANATAINASATSSATGPFSILGNTAATTSSSPTINALTTGELSNEQHTIISQIGGTANDTLSVPWNADGTEPTQITSLKQLGWIKLDQVTTTAGDTKPSSATYSLTPVGQAIYKRTVSSTLGAGTQDAISSAAASSIDSNLQSEVSSLVGTLSAVGVNIQV